MTMIEFVQPTKFPCSWMLNDWVRILLCFTYSEIPDELATNDTMRMIGYVQADGKFKDAILKLKQAIRESLLCKN